MLALLFFKISVIKRKCSFGTDFRSIYVDQVDIESVFTGQMKVGDPTPGRYTANEVSSSDHASRSHCNVHVVLQLAAPARRNSHINNSIRCGKSFVFAGFITACVYVHS